MIFNILYRPINPGDEVLVCNLVALSFNEFIAPGFTEEGVEEFFKYSNPRALRRRSRGGHHVILAEADGKIAGMVEVKELRHLSMLYVDKDFHRKGIASELVTHALDYIRSNTPVPNEVTVNSSIYARPFYESIGFRKTEEEKTIFGILHIPMSCTLSEEKAVNSRTHLTIKNRQPKILETDSTGTSKGFPT